MPLPFVALATLGSSALGAIGQYATNRQNMRIAQMNNQYNRMMMQEQNQWNLDQWHRVNAYNDPSEQRKRYEKAGINPAIALGSISPGTAESLTSAGAHPAETPHLSNPMQPLADGVTNSMNQYLQSKSVEAQIRKTNADAEAVEISNLTEAERKQTELDGMKKSNKLTDSKVVETTMNALETGTLLGPRRRQLEADIKVKLADVDLKGIQKDLSDVEKRIKTYHLENILPKTIEQINAEIHYKMLAGMYLVKQGMVAEAQIPLISAHIANLGANTARSESLTKTENELRDGFSKKLHYEWMNLMKTGQILKKDINWYTSEKLRGWVDTGGRLISNVAGAFKPFGVNVDASTTTSAPSPSSLQSQLGHLYY